MRPPSALPQLPKSDQVNSKKSRPRISYRTRQVPECMSARIHKPLCPASRVRNRAEPTSTIKPRRDKSSGQPLATAAKLPFSWISPLDLRFTTTERDVNVTRCYRSRGMRSDTARRMRRVLQQRNFSESALGSGTSWRYRYGRRLHYLAEYMVSTRCGSTCMKGSSGNIYMLCGSQIFHTIQDDRKEDRRFFRRSHTIGYLIRRCRTQRLRCSRHQEASPQAGLASHTIHVAHLPVSFFSDRPFP